MAVHLHQNDLPGGLDLGPAVAVDTETMGLAHGRDRLCLVQLSAGDGDAHLVQIAPGQRDAPGLRALLEDTKTLKLFHFARFDLCALRAGLSIVCAPVYCTRTASRLARTYSDKHGLKELCRELLGVDISKQQQASDWGAAVLTPEQQAYAAGDVLHLHALKEKLDAMLAREGRAGLAQACFDFLPHRAALDLAGWAGEDIFAH
ncbi:MAG TPA: ribonuclease D [Rhodospirillaceae bacterium]|jgi:ribonuclease D|nr:ribonuclease D [Alphaproteobacteria bacterium]HBH27049.1 ribonuclease D [Rhodospirillaceae bacterium]